MSTVVVYIHGLWLQGHESVLLRRRLRVALRAKTRLFKYASMRLGIKDNAAALQRYLAEIPADTVHLVAHSLGGLITLQMFESRAGALPPGRVVLLGSPVRGSVSAARLARLPCGPSMLGLTAGEVLLRRRDRLWASGRELGVIAGDVAYGLGRLLGPMGAPNDGTVLVEETDLPGATAQLRLHVSHSAMPYSRVVAEQTAAFLRDGRFSRR